MKFSIREMFVADHRTAKQKALDEYPDVLDQVVDKPGDAELRARLDRLAVVAEIPRDQMLADVDRRERESKDEKDAEQIDAALFLRLREALDASGENTVIRSHQREGVAMRRRQQRIEAELRAVRSLLWPGVPLVSTRTAPNIHAVAKARGFLDEARAEKDVAVAAMLAIRAVYSAQDGRAAGATGAEKVIRDALVIIRKWDFRAWLAELSARNEDVRDVVARAFPLTSVLPG